MEDVRKVRVTRKRPGVVHVQIYFTKWGQRPSDFEGDRTMPNDGIDLRDEEIRTNRDLDLRMNDDKRAAVWTAIEKLEERGGYNFSTTFWDGFR